VEQGWIQGGQEESHALLSHGFLYSIMSLIVSTVRGPTYRYTAHNFDWRPVFESLAVLSASIKAVAVHWQVPSETVREHWANHIAVATTPLSPAQRQSSSVEP
jgi:hypothetical protein